jgi:hypothetical protein
MRRVGFHALMRCVRSPTRAILTFFMRELICVVLFPLKFKQPLVSDAEGWASAKASSPDLATAQRPSRVISTEGKLEQTRRFAVSSQLLR